MKLTIIGFEIIAGVSSKKSGKPYDMSKLHTIIPLQQLDTAKGSIGSSYDVPAHVLDKIKGLQPPFTGEVEMQDVYAYGERRQQVVSVVPVDRVKTAAAA